MNLEMIAFFIALFFAMNIGASGTAAAMGPAYGSGAIKSKKIATLLVALCAFLGALLGGEVVKTIGGGIIPNEMIDVPVVIIILASACITLFVANILGIPLSTSEVVVGAIVGIGISFQSLYVTKLLSIVSFWIIIPLIAFILAYLAGLFIRSLERKWPQLKGQGKWKKWLMILLIISGCLEAFAAGMNNVANAVGPLVGAGLISVSTGVIVGGIFVSIGAIILGGRVLETNGKKITRLSLLQGSAISATGGSLVIIASVFGFPVPLTQITTTAIVGIGMVNSGFNMWKKDIVKKIIKVWITSPVVSLVISYGLVLLFLKSDIYTFTVIIGVFIATIGSISLIRSERREKSVIHDQGGGI